MRLSLDGNKKPSYLLFPGLRFASSDSKLTRFSLDQKLSIVKLECSCYTSNGSNPTLVVMYSFLESHLNFLAFRNRRHREPPSVSSDSSFSLLSITLSHSIRIRVLILVG